MITPKHTVPAENYSWLRRQYDELSRQFACLADYAAERAGFTGTDEYMEGYWKWYHDKPKEGTDRDENDGDGP